MSFCEGSPCGPTWRAPRRALGGRVPFSAQGSVFTRQLHNLPVRTSVRPAEHEVLEP